MTDESDDIDDSDEEEEFDWGEAERRARFFEEVGEAMKRIRNRKFGPVSLAKSPFLPALVVILPVPAANLHGLFAARTKVCRRRRRMAVLVIGQPDPAGVHDQHGVGDARPRRYDAEPGGAAVRLADRERAIETGVK